MRTVRGIECFEQEDLCENTNIADAVSAAKYLWESKHFKDSEIASIGRGFEIDFIPKGKRKAIRHMILPVTSNLISQRTQTSETMRECIEVFESYGVRVHFNWGY